jgi:hypothetical protein
MAELRLITKLFPTVDYDFPLDPSYEPEAEPRDDQHEQDFSTLQKFRAAKLVVPVGNAHMYFAAMEDLSCQLTPLGKHYWQLASQGLL